MSMRTFSEKFQGSSRNKSFSELRSFTSKKQKGLKVTMSEGFWRLSKALLKFKAREAKKLRKMKNLKVKAVNMKE